MTGTEDARSDSGPTAAPIVRIATLCLVFCGATIFWLAPRPPMGDLPQHAGQVALLHDLLTGTSPWSDIVYINYFTPYFLAYSIATALSFVIPVVTAFKLVLTAAYLAFVASAVALRKEFGGDPRLDWLFVPVFFGYSFQFGFVSFLVAAPVGLLFLLLAKRHSDECTRAAAVRLVAAGLVLYYSHGLTFVFCVAAGAGMALVKFGRRAGVRPLFPYAILGLVAVAYAVTLRLHDPSLAHHDAPIDWEWNKPFGWHRSFVFLMFVMASHTKDRVLLPAVLLMLAAPWLLGCRPSRDRRALVPLAAVIAVWLFAPNEAAKVPFLYQRFALFLLPAYALAFSPAQAVPRERAWATQAGLALLCAWMIGTIALRQRRFARESAPFETILAAAQPGERALNLILDAYDAYSPASRHLWAYHTYPLWYQAERKGFVDFNFAFFVPEIVRFRPERTPPMEMNVVGLHWHEIDASIYRYFFVRHSKPLPADLFENDQCRVELVREAGEWSLYERRECRY